MPVLSSHDSVVRLSTRRRGFRTGDAFECDYGCSNNTATDVLRFVVVDSTPSDSIIVGVQHSDTLLGARQSIERSRSFDFTSLLTGFPAQAEKSGTGVPTFERSDILQRHQTHQVDNLGNQRSQRSDVCARAKGQCPTIGTGRVHTLASCSLSRQSPCRAIVSTSRATGIGIKAGPTNHSQGRDGPTLGVHVRS